jgi:ketosteroid isomerase-like protein
MAGQAGSGTPHHAYQDEQELRRINDAWVAALEGGDTKTLNTVMDENCIFSYALSGDDKAQFLADIESGELRVDSLKRENVEVCIYGSTGVLIALDMAIWNYKGQHIESPYRSMHVYAKRDEVWQIVAIHASPLPLK